MGAQGITPSSQMVTGAPTPNWSRVNPGNSHGCRVVNSRVFLLSPANCSGTRARMAMAPEARFALAAELRTDAGARLGDVFSFMSGLYFRGKLAYARRFAHPPDPADHVVGGGVLVITPNSGLRSADTPVTVGSIRAFASTSIDLENPDYLDPLQRSARVLLEAVGPDCDVVLLGSIASDKYVDVLMPLFGERLLFPTAFVGRGDMSRGGLMLRHAEDGVELEYAPIAGAIRHGARPPRLTPRTYRTVRTIRTP